MFKKLLSQCQVCIVRVRSQQVRVFETNCACVCVHFAHNCHFELIFMFVCLIFLSSPHGKSGLSATPHTQSRYSLAGQREGSALRRPPQRLGGQPLQQARPAPRQRRLSVQQQRQHGSSLLPNINPLQSASPL